MEIKILIGISACLLGEKVRYDGGHKADHFIINTLGNYVDYIPVCPEVECGLGVPREAMRLIGNRENPRLITIHTRVDHTERMIQWARGRVRELKTLGLCGFIFKSDSPSSGMERVKIYNEQGIPAKNGVGLFAREFMAHFPLLPVEEEGRLHDPGLRENFIERIFALKRWREVLASKPKLKDLVEFHTNHKFLFLSHSRSHYQKMGQLVAQSESKSLTDRFDSYQTLFLEALRIKTTPKKHTDVLMHIMGFFKKNLTADEKQELLELIETYKQGLVPLIVPITMMLHYVRKTNHPYLKNQVYLNPHPLELKLRNHV
jgi:uncharacterized protein YbgA (DUF1722 family)/uncharacterized protein YbbK (DUF523 family)